jgi:hypothetical protein
LAFLNGVSVIVPMLLISCAGVAQIVVGRPGGFDRAPGMLVLCSVLIGAVIFGYRIAASRHTTSQDGLNGQKSGPELWDDELA